LHTASKALLPAPVYTVTSHGPLINTFSLVSTYTAEGAKPKPGVAVGMTAISGFVGCFAERKDALEAAKKAMEELVEGVEGVARTEELPSSFHAPKGKLHSAGLMAEQ
jgi:hypothetical protein